MRTYVGVTAVGAALVTGLLTFAEARTPADQTLQANGLETVAIGAETFESLNTPAGQLPKHFAVWCEANSRVPGTLHVDPLANPPIANGTVAEIATTPNYPGCPLGPYVTIPLPVFTRALGLQPDN